MSSELKRKLPHLARRIEKQQATLKVAFEGAASSAEKRTLKADWEALQTVTADIVPYVVNLIRSIKHTLNAKETFYTSMRFPCELPFTPSNHFTGPLNHPENIDALLKDLSAHVLNFITHYEAEKVFHFSIENQAACPNFIPLLIIEAVSDPILLHSGLKGYAQALIDENSEDDGNDEDLAYAKTLFESRLLFEKEILECEEKEDLDAFLAELIQIIMDDEDLSSHLSFQKLKHFSEFNLKGISNAIFDFLYEESIGYLEEVMEFDEAKINTLLHESVCKNFIRAMADKYHKALLPHLKDAICDSFFRAALKATSSTMIPQIIQEAIDGTPTMRSVFAIEKGRRFAKRDIQVLERARFAVNEQKKKIKDYGLEVKRLRLKVDNLTKNLQTIPKARQVTLTQLEKYTPQEFCEIALNEDGSYTEEKRLLQFLSGEAMLYVEEQVDRGRRGARTEMQKEDFKRAIKFFNTLRMNNNERTLKERLDRYNKELPEYQEKLDRAESALEHYEHAYLFEFDDLLEKMRHYMVKNLAQPPFA